eukprot:CAMPEP_0206469054 /NCGR_PEP_ID=MMETSP0324_2-20121206/30023_1 /ASSEMBLY_ACC=CAM_ASM_000836 /TAXON_ID=2866 /ORGANISM="Crypthecodinium cohnii, Strain Seligo" /LENGTH=173 /DNA_ID=CAMNT_0053942683 /DNA_START=51 /DNA_END=572 /DNA_ORIENTATION=-
MTSLRSNGTMAIPPKRYEPANGGPLYKGVDVLDRFQSSSSTSQDVLDEYVRARSMAPSVHMKALKGSSGLMELHYETMRKKQIERSGWPTAKQLPSMDRPYKACAGYSGLIPGKSANNICGCSWKTGSEMAYEAYGKHLDPPMSSMQFTLGQKSTSSSIKRSSSVPNGLSSSY